MKDFLTQQLPWEGRFYARAGSRLSDLSPSSHCIAASYFWKTARCPPPSSYTTLPQPGKVAALETHASCAWAAFSCLTAGCSGFNNIRLNFSSWIQAGSMNHEFSTGKGVLTAESSKKKLLLPEKCYYGTPEKVCCCNSAEQQGNCNNNCSEGGLKYTKQQLKMARISAHAVKLKSSKSICETSGKEMPDISSEKVMSFSPCITDLTMNSNLAERSS